MAITFHIPAPLREFTGGQRDVEIAAVPTTLADALSALWLVYPGLRDRVATEQGEIREHINIFIGDDNVRFTGGLASRISAGSEISIVPSITGGRAIQIMNPDGSGFGNMTKASCHLRR